MFSPREDKQLFLYTHLLSNSMYVGGKRWLADPAKALFIMMG
jgi:hypothetical protein